jgi:Zn-dependent protease
MDNPYDAFVADDENARLPEEEIIYPPKFTEETETSNAWIKSIASLAIYLALGYYIFKRWELLLLITAVVMLHEMGHFMAMKAFRYKDLGIFFIPLLGAYVSGSKREVSQKESAIILLAGPLPGIILGCIFYLLHLRFPDWTLGTTGLDTVALLLVVLNLFNLIPIYPLDGGQLLNRVFFNEEKWISQFFMYLSIAALGWFAWKMNFPVLYLFPLMMLYRQLSDLKVNKVEKRVEEAGFHTDIDYEHLPDEDYWKIRTIIIEEQPAFKNIDPGPPFQYDERENKIAAVIHDLLHRHLIQDVSVLGKVLIFLIWAAAIASPWLVGLNDLFYRFGFRG